jgi:hypothetical protein
VGLHVAWATMAALVRILTRVSAGLCSLRRESLSSRGSGSDLLLKVHHASCTFERVSPKAIGMLSLILMNSWRTFELCLRNIGVLGVDELIPRAVDGGEALGCDERAATFVVVHADA